jgi:hypothetical protein
VAGMPIFSCYKHTVYENIPYELFRKPYLIETENYPVCVEADWSGEFGGGFLLF